MADVHPAPLAFGRYQCLEPIGGGMADVYRGYDPLMDRAVAIKVLRPAECLDEKMRQRFLREAQLTCRCHHDNVVITYDAGVQDGRPYTVMELLPANSSLSAVLARGGLSRDRILEIAREIASALAYVHSLGIVHRDIKPDNVCIDTASGRAKLIDFGIARTAEWGISTQGTVAGTLAYMAPELMTDGGEPTPLNDVYSYGALLFEMLSGERVVKGQTVAEICLAIANNEPDLAPLRSRGVAPELIELVSACLRKNPAERPQSFLEIGERLAAVAAMPKPDGPAAPSGTPDAVTTCETVPPKKTGVFARRPSASVIIPAACLLLAVLLVVLWPKRPPRELRLGSGDMVLVDAGAALLGPDRHKTAVNAFYIDKYEVSNAAYAEFCRATGRPLPAAEPAPEYPVVNVSFDDAQAFARWAGKRLPRADEWEKAARGHGGLPFPWGTTLDPSRLNWGGAQDHAAPVTSYREGASPYGVVNLVGNVWEWVDAREQPDAGTLKQLHSLNQVQELRPALSAEEAFVQIRGGSFLGSKLEEPERLVYGSALLPGRVRLPDVGFRCAKDVPK
jgi:serine/threonine-protein kinase